MSCARKPVDLPYVNLGCQPRMLKHSKLNKRTHYPSSVHLSLSIQQMSVVYRLCVKYCAEHTKMNMTPSFLNPGSQNSQPQTFDPSCLHSPWQNDSSF